MGWDFKNSLKRWRIGDYFRQFSIVTAGVMVTFIGSDLISNISTQKQLKSCMQLVIRELDSNKEEIENVKYKYERDCTMANYLIDADFDIDRCSLDTLRKYQTFISQISAFTYSTDALEVLKTSSLQAIDDKNLLLSVIETYKVLDQVQKGMSTYYDLKKSIILPVVLEREQSADENDTYDSYKSILANKAALNFCNIVPGFLDEDYLDRQIRFIDQTTNKLKELYY